MFLHHRNSNLRYKSTNIGNRHAGYAYSGPAAAYAYTSLSILPSTKRIFLIGPSHHYYLETCALSQCTSYSTPLGSLSLDLATIAALASTGQFSKMTCSQDEDEHSLEMHLPYIYKILSTSSFGSDVSKFPKLVPILVGNTTLASEKRYGEILAPYLEDPDNVFIISSDFCHWGTRFRYTYYQPATGAAKRLRANERVSSSGRAIHESIAAVDQESWEACESGSHEAFVTQVERTGNTVCGRHPIGVMMAAMEVWRSKHLEREAKGKFRFVRYERSGLVENVSDSSVSYCSAYAVL